MGFGDRRALVLARTTFVASCPIRIRFHHKLAFPASMVLTVARVKAPPTTKIHLPFAVYFERKEVWDLYPHEKCADSLLRVFERLADVYPNRESRREAGIVVYDGLYNPRKIRGGSNAWSMHAWAIAINLNADYNGLSTYWPLRSTMPIEVMECFSYEGWLSAGAFWSRDAMHFQATQ